MTINGFEDFQNILDIWLLKSLLLNPFRFGWNNQKISYQDAIRNGNTTRSTLGPISASFGSFRPFRQISVNFGWYQLLEEKKKKKKEKSLNLQTHQHSMSLPSNDCLKNKPSHRRLRSFSSSFRLRLFANLLFFPFFTLVFVLFYICVCLVDFQFADPTHVTKFWK